MRSTPAWVRTPADLSRYGGPLLLDTHIWVWRLKGETDRVTGDLMPLLDRSSSEGGVWVLDISYWEVAMKSAKGQLSFSVDPAVWLKRAREAPDIRPLRLDPDILLGQHSAGRHSAQRSSGPHADRGGAAEQPAARDGRPPNHRLRESQSRHTRRGCAEAGPHGSPRDRLDRTGPLSAPSGNERRVRAVYGRPSFYGWARPNLEAANPAEERAELEDAERCQLAGRLGLKRVEAVPLEPVHQRIECGGHVALAIDHAAAREGDRLGDGSGLRRLDELFDGAQVYIVSAE